MPRADPLAEKYPDGKFVWVCSTCSTPREPGEGKCPRCGDVEFGLRLRDYKQRSLFEDE